MDVPKSHPAGERIQALIASNYAVPLILAFLTLISLGPALFGPKGAVVSNPDTDLALMFAYFRDFGFGEMRQGHLALWTPHIFSGCPFLGNWQSALLYPPNAIYLILPLAKAIDWDIAFHVFITGLGTSLWVRRNGVSRLGSLLAACMVMFGAPYFMHVYAGHLTAVDAMAWLPWLLLAADGLLERLEARWIVLGAGVFALQVLAGHPQTAFNSGIAVGLYVLLRLIRAPRRAQTVGAFVVIGVGALLLSAAQIDAGLQAAADSVRTHGLRYVVASQFSFAPENFFTLLVPSFFGNMSTIPYWGRWYLWEMDLFLGTTGIALAIFGMVRGRSDRRWIWITMVVVLLWIALAAYTPLFHLLYSYVPGFNKFRSHSKFIYPASLFLAILGAQGLDALRRQGRAVQRLAIGVGVVAALLAGFGAFLIGTQTAGRPGLFWLRIAESVFKTGQWYLSPNIFRSSAFLAAAQGSAGIYCFVAAAVMAGFTILLFLLPKRPKLLYAIAALGVVEIAGYACLTVATWNISKIAPPPGEERFLAAHPGDYRVLRLGQPVNYAYLSSHEDIWGYDPTVLNRYAQFVTFTQRQNPDDASIYVTFTTMSPLLQIFRCRYVFFPQPGHKMGFYEFKHPLPHVFLAQNWTPVQGRDNIFAALSSPSFDPAKSVILETPDVPVPRVSPALGTAQVTGQTSGTVTVLADVSQPTLLVVTDPYSPDWRAIGLPGSSRKGYRVLPADYAAMAIPLSAGHHLLRLYYQPKGFIPALWLSAISWIVWVLFAAWLSLRRWRGALPKPILPAEEQTIQSA